MASFSKRLLPQRLISWGQPDHRLRPGERWAPQEPPIPQQQMATERVENCILQRQVEIQFASLELPIVCTILSKETCSVINCQRLMKITPMVQSIAIHYTCIAGRIAQFMLSWRVITQDAWVLDCVREYSIALTGTPYQFGGPWSKTKRQLHINCLELLAATQQSGALQRRKAAY